jgi:hypothetical protein
MKTAFQPFVLGLLASCGQVANTTPDAATDGAAADGGADAVAIDGPAGLVCGPDKAACVGAACGSAMCLQPAHVPNGFGTFAAPALASIIVDSAVSFDTSTGAISRLRAPNATPSSYEVISGIGFIRRGQPAAGPIAIWMFGDLTIAAAVRATGAASVVLASTSSLRVAATGSIDAGARGIEPGPGGLLGGTFRTAGTGCGGGGAPSGTGEGGDNGGTDGGGGGAGFGTSGAAGGSGVGGPGPAGSAAPCAGALDVILVGGSGGGGGDNTSSVTGPFGGGGGGALQLTALGQLRVEGTINLGGGGGRTAEGNSRDGGGGGSGGALFLEAPAIAIAASAGIFANGGGGGSASPSTPTCAGPLAEDGKPSLAVAAGSTCAVGNGGAGAAGSTAATAGASDTAAGGGGGGLGRIVLRTLATQTPSIASTRLSPAATSSAFQIVKTLN